MAIAIKNLFTGKNVMRSVLAFMWSSFAMFYLVLITITTVPKSNTRIVDTILGFLLGTVISGVLAFYYSSTQGSSEKDEMLAKMTPTPDVSSSVTVTKSEIKSEEPQKP